MKTFFRFKNPYYSFHKKLKFRALSDPIVTADKILARFQFRKKYHFQHATIMESYDLLILSMLTLTLFVRTSA